jgi:hypothetical protein
MNEPYLSLPSGYRWATAEEVENHLNGPGVADAVWVYRSNDDFGDYSDLAVPA